jgi:peptide chain release factor 2
VRITHIPTGIVTQCQNERSQHQNKAQAMNMLRSRLYQEALNEKMSLQKELEKGKDNITWGQQIRSYTLDQSRIKDLRTGIETRNPQDVLNGDLMFFIEASLHQLAKGGTDS